MSQRALAAVVVLVTGGVFAWLYLDYAAGEGIPIGAFALPPVMLLGLAGLVDPRVLRHRRRDGRPNARNVTIARTVLLIVGFALSCALMWAR